MNFRPTSGKRARDAEEGEDLLLQVGEFKVKTRTARPLRRRTYRSA